MNNSITVEGIREAFFEIEKVAYTQSNQGRRTREFLLSFHDRRSVDIFGFVNLDRKLQRHAMHLIESHIHSPHCIANLFKDNLKELSRFDQL